AGLGWLPRWLRIGVVAGAIADVAIGILLQTIVQSRDIALMLVQGVQWPPLDDRMPNLVAVSNSLLKHRMGLAFLGDHTSGWATGVSITVVVVFTVIIAQLAVNAGRAPVVPSACAAVVFTAVTFFADPLAQHFVPGSMSEFYANGLQQYQHGQ